MARSSTSAWRGSFTRLVAVVLGVVIAAALIVGLTVAAPVPPATVTVVPNAFPVSSTPTAFDYPASGPAAWYADDGGGGAVRDNTPAPIASVTKMMAALVLLDALPLTLHQTGPCTVTTASDVAVYQHFQATGQSDAAVAQGVTLCERTLLDGVLIRSAGNYFPLLERLARIDQATLVARMNLRARLMALTHTHYVEPTGYDPNNVSTAAEQIDVARALMAIPVAAAIVNHDAVTLPVAGTVPSWTPLAGIGDVVGVKSGRTEAAGGCDVLALRYRDATGSHLVYAAVLDQRGGDLVTPAGAAADALARSVVRNRRTHVFPAGTVVATVGWGASRTTVVTAHAVRVSWWAWRTSPPPVIRSLVVGRSVRRGDHVGRLVVATSSVALVAQGNASPPSLWQRLR